MSDFSYAWTLLIGAALTEIGIYEGWRVAHSPVIVIVGTLITMGSLHFARWLYRRYRVIRRHRPAP